ncbi:unnamed protein product [Lymnaea stagnalis]|uniref:Ig-like domain-containing protein n=1 Tax=Lymnaea stagnalis TaxID=6523 RepID=A0AAV2HQT1_LYMST
MKMASFDISWVDSLDFCKVDHASWDSSVPGAILSENCPYGEDVKNGFIRRGATATCECDIQALTLLTGQLYWFGNEGQPVETNENGDVLNVSYNSTQGSQATFSCAFVAGLVQMGEKAVFATKFYSEPQVVNFTVNGSRSVTVKVNNSVTFYCQVEAEPPAKAVLTGSGLGKVQELTSASDVFQLTLHDLECEDSGRYFCSGRNGFEDNATSSRDYVDVNIICRQNPRFSSDAFKTLHFFTNENTLFTIEIYGFPAPQSFYLKIETRDSTHDVEQDNYSITYLHLTPPFGLVNVSIYDANTKGTTTYILGIVNEAGEFQVKIQVIKEEKSITTRIFEKQPDVDVAIGVGAGGGAALLVIVTLVVICLVKRKRDGKRSRTKLREDADTQLTPNHQDGYITPLDVNIIAGPKNTDFLQECVRDQRGHGHPTTNVGPTSAKNPKPHAPQKRAPTIPSF